MYRHILKLLLGSLLFLNVISLAPKLQAQVDPAGTAWDLKHSDQPGQITLYDSPAGASSTGKPVEIGDFDGDGCGDVAMTGQNARGAAGHIRIFFRLCEAGWGTIVDAVAPEALPTGVRMITIVGEYSGDMLGTELIHADFNADGYDDLLVSAQNNDAINRGRSGTGAAYIIFGSDDLPSQNMIELLTPPENVLKIYGEDAADRFGIWVESGDFDGDGFADALIGANQADGIDNNLSNTGEVYILYGSENLFETYGATIDLAEVVPEDMTRIVGTNYDDLLGSTVYGADLNMDGVDDAIMSGALWRGSAGVGGLAQGGADGPLNDRYNSGDTYVIFGSEALRGEVINLAEMLDESGTPRNESLAVVYGAEGQDYMGEEIVVGDLNADGWNDLVVGSLRAPSRDNLRIDGGEAWVVYVDEDFPGSAVDLAVEGAGVPIYAPAPDNKGGDTMLINDIDQDGYLDLLFGMPNSDAVGADGRNRPNAGVLAIIYGQNGEFPTTDGFIDLAEPPADLRIDFMLGIDPYDMSAYGMSWGDIDGDGFPDVALNGMNGDGPDNRRTDAGEIYLVSGQHFTAMMQSGEVAEVLPEGTEQVSALEPEAHATIDIASIERLDLETGQQLYEEVCAGCHGVQGEGVAGIAVPLVGSAMLELSDEGLFEFVRVGRSASHPDSITGRTMPPSGGRPDLTDAELLAILDYIRSLDAE